MKSGGSLLFLVVKQDSLHANHKLGILNVSISSAARVIKMLTHLYDELFAGTMMVGTIIDDCTI